MKTTGIVRKIDNLGRFVLPKELRSNLGIGKNAPLEVFVDEDKIVLRKYDMQNNACVFCGEENNLKQYKDKYICRNCTKELKA